MEPIRTARLTLEPLDAGTAAAIVAGARDGRPWAADFPAAGDLRVARAFAPPARPAVWAQPWVVVYEGAAVGTAGFKGAPSDDCVEVGYGIVPSAQRRGIATEAVAGLLGAAAEQGIRVVIAQTLPDNEPSRRVLVKLGFERTGTAGGGELVVWELHLGR